MKNQKQSLLSLSVDQLIYLKSEFIKYENKCKEIELEINNEIRLFKEKSIRIIKKMNNLISQQNHIINMLNSYKPSIIQSLKGGNVEYHVKKFHLKEVLNIVSEKYIFPENYDQTLENLYDNRFGSSGRSDEFFSSKSKIDGKEFVQQLNSVQKEIEQFRHDIFRLELEAYRKVSSLKKTKYVSVTVDERRKNKEFYLSTIKLVDIENAINTSGAKEREKAKIAAYDKKARLISQNIKRKLGNQLKIYPKCPYCHKDIDLNNAHADHIYPVTKGGQSVSKNMVFVCSSCNLAKGKLTIRKFLIQNNLNKDLTYSVLEKLGKDF